MVKPRDRLAKLLLAGARNARNSQDLAAIGREAHIPHGGHALRVDAGKPVYLEHLFLVFHHGALDLKADATADHRLGQRLLRCLRCLHRADVFALAQDGHAVGNVKHLVQLMRDDDDGFSVGLHGAEHVKQLLCFLRRQDGGRLVQNEDISTPVEHLHDLDGLLFGNRHVVDLLVRVDLKTILPADLADARSRLPPVQLYAARKAQYDIFRRGQHVHKLEVLVDHADAKVKRVLGRADLHFLSLDEDLAMIRVINARKHVHERGLATPILAQKRKDFAFAQRKADIVVRYDLAECFSDAAHFDCVLDLFHAFASPSGYGWTCAACPSIS